MRGQSSYYRAHWLTVAGRKDLQTEGGQAGRGSYRDRDSWSRTDVGLTRFLSGSVTGRG